MRTVARVRRVAAEGAEPVTNSSMSSASDVYWERRPNFCQIPTAKEMAQTPASTQRVVAPMRGHNSATVTRVARSRSGAD